jgi:hypothetical protein
MNWNLIIFIGTPLIGILIMVLQDLYHSLDTIRAEWSSVRCDPLYIPFAGIIRPDVGVEANFSYCLNALGTQVLKYPVDAVNEVMGTVNSSVGEISKPVSIFRGLFGKLRLFMFSFMASALGKVTNSSSELVHILIKIRDVLQRFAGGGYIAAFIASTAVSFIEAFITLCISVIKGFVYALLAISIILAFFQPELLEIAITLASLLAAAGA